MIERLLNRDDYWGMLDQAYSSISLQLDEYKNIGIIVEGQFNSFLERIGDEIDGFRKKLSNHEANHEPVKNFEDSAWGIELDSLYAAYDNVKEIFPARVRAGLFLAVYGFVEHELLVLANNYNLGTESSPKDLKERGIKRATVHFRKVMGIVLPNSILQGPKYELVNLVRNTLAHRSGYLAEERSEGFKRYRMKCRLDDDVKTNLIGLVLLQQAFLPWFIDSAAGTFEAVISRLKTFVGKQFQQGQ